MKHLHKIFGVLFSIYFLNHTIAFGAGLFNVTIPVLPIYYFVIVLTGYFLMMAAFSYNASSRRVYPILFMIMIGIIWLLPQYMILYLFFLITYTFMYQRGERYAIPLSYISIGHVVMIFIPIAGYMVVLYGWLIYTFKKPA